MNLKNNTITVKELMQNEKAKNYLLKALTGYINPQMIFMASSMTLAQVLTFANGRIPQQQVKNILDTLKTL